jgi:hypothetical protein
MEAAANAEERRSGERQNQANVTTREENDWVEYDPKDLKTHPKEGALVEAQYESGRHGEATYSDECGGFSKTFRFGETPDETTVKRWRYK